jgi:hypothetical protein
MKINHWNRFVRTGVARFLLPKTEKMYQININCTEWTEHIPNARKILQMAIKYRWTFSNQRPSKIYPNWDFWFEIKPSGNPVLSSVSNFLSFVHTYVVCLWQCWRSPAFMLGWFRNKTQFQRNLNWVLANSLDRKIELLKHNWSKDRTFKT